jgi:two-component system, NarL family, sensor kinase
VDRSSGGRPARTLLLRFALAGLAALVVVALATALLARQVAEREGRREAERIAWASGRGVVQPALTDGVVTMEPAALQAVDAVVREAVLSGSLVRVKVWAADGTVVYSDESRLIGERFELDDGERSLFGTDETAAEISDLDDPENRYERTQDRLLETYLGVETPDGTPLLFEAYFRYDGIVDVGRDVWLSFAPVTLGALLLLQLVQLPLAWSLARSLRRSQEQRELLLSHAVDASDRERRRIARDLHDGVVQDLTGVSYELAAAARRGDASPVDRLTFEAASGRVRDSIGSLRSLLVDIYPPNLRDEGLRTALENLLVGLSNRGIHTSLDVEIDDANLPDSVCALLYRGAQEAVRNVASHAGATSVRLVVSSRHGNAVLVVDDDGQGFEAARAGEVSEDGHVGLRALADLVAEAGGTVEIASGPGHGTEIRVEVPV